MLIVQSFIVHSNDSIKCQKIPFEIINIIDAREIFVETPNNPDKQKKNWSEYKHHNTFKLV